MPTHIVQQRVMIPRTAELRQLADPAAWDERCCLAKDTPKAEQSHSADPAPLAALASGGSISSRGVGFLDREVFRFDADMFKPGPK